MATPIWKGQLTFGLVSFPVRLLKAARKERTSAKFVQSGKTRTGESDASQAKSPSDAEAAPVHVSYEAQGSSKHFSPSEIQRGYEVGPNEVVVVGSDELKSLRQETSPDMQILRSVKMDEIDPIFLETSYYVVPESAAERSYALFYRALAETKLAALGQVAMHGREHVMVVRAGAKGLIAHTMYYVNEVRGAEEYAADTKTVAAKELALAKHLVEAIEAPFKPEEFTDRYREKLQNLISSKQPVHEAGKAEEKPAKKSGKVVDIMDALRKSLENVERKPAAATAGQRKTRKRSA